MEVPCLVPGSGATASIPATASPSPPSPPSQPPSHNHDIDDNHQHNKPEAPAMVTYIVTNFLPWRLDFHEFDAPERGADPPPKPVHKTSISEIERLTGQDILRPGPNSSGADKGENDSSSSGSSSAATEDGHEPYSMFDVFERGDRDAEAEASSSMPTGPTPDGRKRRPSLQRILDLESDSMGAPTQEDLDKWFAHQAYTLEDIDKAAAAHRDGVRIDSVVADLWADHPGTHGQNFKTPIPEDTSFVPYKFDDSKYTIERGVLMNGALYAAAEYSKPGKATNKIWVGSVANIPLDKISPLRKQHISDHLLNDHNSQMVWLSDEDLDGHYGHFCKTILWPVLHYQMPDNLLARAWEEKSFKHYVKVNQAYADSILSTYKHGDIVWVHDYHLMLVPQMLRARMPNAKIGFFMHTSFPSSELWRCVSARTELLRGILGANVIGFQTTEYGKHFQQACRRFLLTPFGSDGICWDDRQVKVFVRGIGLTTKFIDRVREVFEERLKGWIKELEREHAGKTLIVARDKYDSFRGIRQKLLAYEHLLDTHPGLHKQVVFLQVATSSTKKIESMADCHDVVCRINDKYKDLHTNPLIFTIADRSYPAYLAMISAADILMTTPQREGMGITPQEFIYAQSGWGSTKKHGALILSKGCGVHELLKDHVLSCNTWDPVNMADLLHQAIKMTANEKQTRWNRLYSIVQQNSGERWWHALQNTLEDSYIRQNRRQPVNLPRINVNNAIDGFGNSQKRLLILDHEHALVAEGVHPDHFNGVLKILKLFVADPSTVVYITSALPRSELEGFYASVPGLGLIAENGHFIHDAGHKKGHWAQAHPGGNVRNWLMELQSLLSTAVKNMEGAKVTTTAGTINIDWSKVLDDEAAVTVLGELISNIEVFGKTLGIKAVPAHPPSKKMLIISRKDHSKLTAIRTVYEAIRINDRTDFPFDFILAASGSPDFNDIFTWAIGISDAAGERLARRTGGPITVPVVPVVSVWLAKSITNAEATLDGGPGALRGFLDRLCSVHHRAIIDLKVERLGRAPINRRWENGEALKTAYTDDSYDDDDCSSTASGGLFEIQQTSHGMQMVNLGRPSHRRDSEQCEHCGRE